MAGFHTTGPNQALIISGGGKEPKVVVGGRVFVMPILQRVQTLSLEVMTLTPSTNRVYTKEGVAVSVDGVAQVKVKGDSILRAAQQFLGKRLQEIEEVALQTLEGNQRAILGTMTVEEIYQDREGFASRVLSVGSTDMDNMGLEIVSYTIREIQDEQGYLEALGIPRTAEVKRDAAIAQAEADRDSAIRSALADQESQAARFSADTVIAESERDFSIQKAAYDQETNARRAAAELAYALQEAKTKQDIRLEEMQIDVIERQKQIEVQQQEVLRREQELDATIRRPAEAERFQLVTVAEGNKARVVAEAEAEADAIRVRGQAEADAIRAKGLAEAEAMHRKADAWKEYGQAALIEQLFQTLPQVAEAVAQPLAKTDRIVMISSGNDDSAGMGASRLTRDVTNIIAQIPEVIEALTGIDVLGSLKNLKAVKTTDELEAEKREQE
ncbi:MAG: flotillin family protein [Chloroflexi bacterium]|nr:flotillin family protein [Chloroflexota bacterium]